MVRDREQLGATFDRSAELYDEVRPVYPADLIDDLVRFSAIPDGGRILEIGCGTGKATLPFARRGYRLLCLEPGANLAAVARHNLAAFPSVEVRVASFEEWALESAAFDLVVAATSFAWVDPAVRYWKTIEALRPGGCVAVFWLAHVQLPGEGGFYDAVQELYRRYMPEEAGRPRSPADLPTTVDPAFLATGLGEEVAVRHYPWAEIYPTARYLDLLRTFSGHIALPEPARQALFDGVAALIDREFDGQLVRNHVAVLQLARRV
ncbi:MAG: class I SAM-dependent methyltransferase [Thermomicrobiales bacterium]